MISQTSALFIQQELKKETMDTLNLGARKTDFFHLQQALSAWSFFQTPV